MDKEIGENVKSFVRFRVLDTIVSDNGKQFTEKEFKDFCKAILIVYTTIAPYYSQSNRQALRFVETFKQALKKSGGKESVDDILQFLRVYRVTPNLSINSVLSLAELMFVRKRKYVFKNLLTKEKVIK